MIGPRCTLSLWMTGRGEERVGDAPARGVSWVEGYPHNTPERNDAGHFRGPRSMYDARGFEAIEVREHDTVVRRRVG